MQTLITGLIIVAALFYVANRWLPTKIKQRLMRWSGKSSPVPTATGSCSSCSSCGNCGSNPGKLIKK